MTFSLKALIDELRSQKPETVVANLFIDLMPHCVFALLILGLAALADVVRRYIPSVRGYVTPGLSWLIGGAVWIVAVVVVLVYYRFTNRGRRKSLLRLLRLVRRYNRFNHEKELEVVSRIHSQTRKAALVLLSTFLMAAPLAVVILLLFGVAIISDITNNIKGTQLNPPMGSKLFFNAYGIGLGLSFSWIFFLLESAHQESLMLSAKYRRKRIVNLQIRIVEIKSKLLKQAPEKALARSASASA